MLGMLRKSASSSSQPSGRSGTARLKHGRRVGDPVQVAELVRVDCLAVLRGRVGRRKRPPDHERFDAASPASDTGRPGARHPAGRVNGYGHLLPDSIDWTRFAMDAYITAGQAEEGRR